MSIADANILEQGTDDVSLADEDMVLDIRYVFRSSPYASGLRNIEAGFNDGKLELRGRVESFYLKQIAQHLAQSEVAVVGIVNCIEVKQRARGKIRR